MPDGKLIGDNYFKGPSKGGDKCKLFQLLFISKRSKESKIILIFNFLEIAEPKSLERNRNY